jgi:Protein of unknown function (DUF1573)
MTTVKTRQESSARGVVNAITFPDGIRLGTCQHGGGRVGCRAQHKAKQTEKSKIIMKKKFFAAMLCGALAASVLRAEQTNAPAEPAKPPTGGTPKIQFDNTVYDFGTTTQVESVTGTFTFHNAGDGELKLQKPAPSCGCTVAGVKPDVLKPGEKGELSFTVRLSGVRGQVEKHITVPSNDPQSPSVNLSIKAAIQQIYEVNPTQVSIGSISQGVTTNVTVQVHRTDGKKLSITKTEVTGDLAKVRIEPGENDQSAKLVVEVTGKGASRRFGDQVKLFMDGAEQPTVAIYVIGQLMGDVNLTPEALYWGVTDPEHWPGSYPESMTTRRVTITSGQTNKPLEIQNPTSSLKGLSLELVPQEKGKTYTLVAKLTEAPKESTRGTISFDTNIPSQPKIVVPVTVNVLKR